MNSTSRQVNNLEGEIFEKLRKEEGFPFEWKRHQINELLKLANEHLKSSANPDWTNNTWATINACCSELTRRSNFWWTIATIALSVVAILISTISTVIQIYLK